MVDEHEPNENPESELQPIALEEMENQLPLENVELFRAIVELSSAPEMDRTRLYAAVMAAVFTVPLSSEPPPPGPEGEAQEVQLNVMTLTGPSGEMVIPAFTHAEALRQWNSSEVPTFQAPAQGLFQMLIASPVQVVAINPAGPFGGPLARSEFEPLAQGMLPGLAQPNAPAQAAPPSIYVDVPLVPMSDATCQKLYDMLEANAAVETAHLFLMQVGENSAPRLTLGLWVEGAAGQWAVPQITRRLQQEKLDFQPYDCLDLRLLDDSAASVRQAVPPFFERVRPQPEQGFARTGSHSASTAADTEPGPAEAQPTDVDQSPFVEGSPAGDEFSTDEDSPMDEGQLVDEEPPSAEDTSDMQEPPQVEAGPAKTRRRWLFGRR